jgi:hypothetical protein
MSVISCLWHSQIIVMPEAESSKLDQTRHFADHFLLGQSDRTFGCFDGKVRHLPHIQSSKQIYSFYWKKDSCIEMMPVNTAHFIGKCSQVGILQVKTIDGTKFCNS